MLSATMSSSPVSTVKASNGLTYTYDGDEDGTGNVVIKLPEQSVNTSVYYGRVQVNEYGVVTSGYTSDGQSLSVSKTGHGFTVGEPLHLGVTVGGAVSWVAAQATADGTLATTHFVVEVPDSNIFVAASSGIWAASLTVLGEQYLSGTAGTTANAPTSGLISQYLGIYDGTNLHINIMHPQFIAR